MRRSISILLAAAMVVSGAATSVAPVQAAMPQAVPVAPTAVPISHGQDNAQSQLWYVGDRGGWGGRGWGHRGGWGGRGWGHGGGWDGGGGWDDGWGSRYGRHHDQGGALALGIFGLATGALLGSQLYGGYGGYGGGYYGGGDGGGYYGGGDAYDGHDAACDQRFRSYDWRSDTYMGYDGQRHYC
jgi:hypothetical protein